MKEIRTQSPRSEARCRPIFAAGLAIGSCGESGRAGYGISLLARFIVDKINRFLGGSAVLCLPCVLREHGRPGTWHQRIYKTELKVASIGTAPYSFRVLL